MSIAEGSTSSSAPVAGRLAGLHAAYFSQLTHDLSLTPEKQSKPVQAPTEDLSDGVRDEQIARLRAMLPANPQVGFYLVDYLSGSVTDAAAAAHASGYTGVGFSALADTGHVLMNGLQATMGTTVVIDATGTIRMNEDFRDGTHLQAVLAGLP